MRVVTVPAGSTIDGTGEVLAQTTLSAGHSYVLTAQVTATSPQTGSMMCQLVRANQASWDDIGEDDLSSRATVPLSYTYQPTRANVTVMLACRYDGTTDTVDAGRLLVWQVGSISSGSGPVLYSHAPALRWE